MFDVVAVGELLIDFTTQSTDGDGYPTMAAHPGGAPSNFLAALSRYGVSTALLGKVGDDRFGSMLCGTLEQAGVDVRGVLHDPAVFTTLAFVTVDERGERSFSFARKPGADTQLRQEEVDLSLIDGAKVFHFGTLSLTDEPARSATRMAVAYARQRGKLITYDPNLRPPLWASVEAAREQILWGLHQADVAKLSDEEVRFLWNCDAREGARRLREEFGIRLAMVSMGENGCYLENARGSCRVLIPEVHPVDTTGAGDIFGGAAVSRLLKLGKAPEELDQAELTELARFATTAASLSTERFGGISSIPDMDTVLSRLDHSRVDT